MSNMIFDIIELPTKKPSRLGRCIKAIGDVEVGSIRYFQSAKKMSLEHYRPVHIHVVRNTSISQFDYHILRGEVVEHTKTMVIRNRKKIFVSTDSLLIKEKNLHSIRIPKFPERFIKQYCDLGGVKSVSIGTTMKKIYVDEEDAYGYDVDEITVGKFQTIKVISIHNAPIVEFTKNDLWHAYRASNTIFKDDSNELREEFEEWFERYNN